MVNWEKVVYLCAYYVRKIICPIFLWYYSLFCFAFTKPYKHCTHTFFAIFVSRMYWNSMQGEHVMTRLWLTSQSCLSTISTADSRIRNYYSLSLCSGKTSHTLSISFCLFHSCFSFPCSLDSAIFGCFDSKFCSNNGKWWKAMHRAKKWTRLLLQNFNFCIEIESCARKKFVYYHLLGKCLFEFYIW